MISCRQPVSTNPTFRTIPNKTRRRSAYESHVSENRNRLNNRPTTHRLRRGFALYAVAALACCLATPALAAGDPLAVIDNLNNFIFSIIRAVGLILLGWGIVQVGLSLQSHDPSQRSQGFLTLAGGIIITFAREILDLIIGTGA